MNKTFKVIYNRLRGKYMVADEYTTSMGKASGGCKAIAPAVVAACLFSGLAAVEPAMAYYTSYSQYLAFKDGLSVTWDGAEATDSNGNTYRMLDGHKYIKQTVTYTETDPASVTADNHPDNYALNKEYSVQYWVREGYQLSATVEKRFDDAAYFENSSKTRNLLLTYAINSSYGTDSSTGLLKAVSAVSKSAGAETNIGAQLNDASIKTVSGATNGSINNEVDWNLRADLDGDGVYETINASSGQTSTSQTFYKIGGSDGKLTSKTSTTNGVTTTLYYFNGNSIDPSNVYAFTTSNGSNEPITTVGVFSKDGVSVYTGNVFGGNNEILVSAEDSSGNLYSYWATESETYSDVVTEGQFNRVMETMLGNDKKLLANDIKSINLTGETNTIALARNSGDPVQPKSRLISSFFQNNLSD